MRVWLFGSHSAPRLPSPLRPGYNAGMSGSHRNRWLTGCYVTVITFVVLMLSAIGFGSIVGAPIDVHSWPDGSEGAWIAALLAFWVAAPIALIAGGVVVFWRRND